MKTLKSIALFISITIVLFASMFYIAVKMEYKRVPVINRVNTFYDVKGNNIYRRFHEFDQSKDWDVLIFGTSHAYRGYNPRVFEENGLFCYNLGSSAQHIKDTYHIIDHLNNRPKLLLVDIYPGAFETEGIESASRLITNVDSDELAKDIAFSSFNWMLSSVYLKRRTEENRKPVFLEDKVELNNYYKGYVGKTDSLNEPIDLKNYGKSFQPNPTALRYFEMLIEKLSTLDKKVVFVTHPQPSRIDRTENEELEKTIRKMITEKIVYLNLAFEFSNEIDTPHSFYDYHHLNSDGAKKYNLLLLDTLRKIDLLPKTTAD